LRLSLCFDIPLQDWLGAILPPPCFATPTAVPAGVPWLSARRHPVPTAHVAAILRRSLDTPTEAPPSLLALTRTIPVSDAHVHRAFPVLARRIVARHRAFRAQHKIARAARNSGLVHEAVDYLMTRGMALTPAAVLANLGSRWPLSRRRLRAILSEVSKN
jgi:hypothetical protein